MRTRTVLILLAAAVFAVVVFYPRPPKHYQRVGVQGKVHFVVVEPEHARNRAVYEEAIASLCGTRGICRIMFWTERAMVPRALPMTDEQVEAQVAQFELNSNTGHREFFFMEGGEQVE